LFEKFGVFSAEETVARKNIALDAYTGQITIEAGALLKMLDSQVMPALAKDLDTYKNFETGVDRAGLYSKVASLTNELRTSLDGVPEGEQESADYCAGTLRPAMDAVRDATDQAEGLCENWPFPSYQDICFNHSTEGSGSF